MPARLVSLALVGRAALGPGTVRACVRAATSIGIHGWLAGIHTCTYVRVRRRQLDTHADRLETGGRTDGPACLVGRTRAIHQCTDGAFLWRERDVVVDVRARLVVLFSV